MNEYIKPILEVSKACVTVRKTASGLVTHRPAYVFFISSCPTDGAALYEGAVHNGETSGADVLIDIERQYGQDHSQLALPVYFNRGIYLALTTNMKSITIQYLEE